MVATAVSKTVKIIDKTSTIRTVTLYDNKEDFPDYNGGDYIAFHDGTAFRYAYCSSILYTKSTGEPTSYLICNFIDKNGNIRYMYTQQPDITEVLYKTITSNVSDATLMPAVDNIWGCKIYLVNTKGSNGKYGDSGGNGVRVDKYTYYEGYAGAGGTGGSSGKSVYANLSVGDSSLNMTLEGMCGAGGGGGGGAGYYNSSGATPGGSGGSGGVANNASKSYWATIKNNNEVTGNISFSYNSAYSGKNGFAGQKGYGNDNDGGMGGASGDGHLGSYGGDGTRSGGGYGGNGGYAGSSRTGSVSGNAVETKATGFGTFDSSNISFTSAVASTGGVVITKLIASFPG